MKTNNLSILRITLAVCVLTITSFNANAQLKKKLKTSTGALTSASKIKPIITSPTTGSTIDGRFVLVGKAELNSAVNIVVSPIYKLPKSTTGKTVLRVSTPLHEPQHFTAKADENGVWKSGLIEVHYDLKQSIKEYLRLYIKYGVPKYCKVAIQNICVAKIVLKGKMLF